MSDKEMVTTKMVYCGLRTDTKGKLFCKYKIIEGDWTGRILQFDKDPGLDKCPGNVYLAPYDGISIRCNLEYDGEYEDQEFRLECQAQDKVARNESYLMKREAKMKREGDDLIRDCLRPLSKVYHSTNAAGRSVLLAQIIQYVQRKL